MDNLGALLPLLIIVVLFYFLLLRPARNQQQRVKRTQASLAPRQPGRHHRRPARHGRGSSGTAPWCSTRNPAGCA